MQKSILSVKECIVHIISRNKGKTKIVDVLVLVVVVVNGGW